MSARFAAPKGMNDILPAESHRWQGLERLLRGLSHAYGYREIRTPIPEATALFTRGLGEATDVVEKEMFSWEDQGGDRLTLRPEGTAPTVRAYVEHRLDAQEPVSKLYYIGPMFRRERPQRGRYRQFHQWGAELIGAEEPAADAEVIALLVTALRQLRAEGVRVLLNSIGDDACRPAYREELQRFLRGRLDRLCEASRARVETNPMRVLDCKVPGCIEATADAPRMIDRLCEPCAAHFAELRRLLDLLGVEVAIDPRLVRGFDYYTRTAFEVQMAYEGAQNAVAGGGRYDRLVEELGGAPTPALGFAVGLERLLALVPADLFAAPAAAVFVAAVGARARDLALPLVDRLRRQGVAAEFALAGRGQSGAPSLKSQLRRADRSGAPRAVILDDRDIERGVAILRDLAMSRQEEVPLADLEPRLAALLAPRA
ncbi:MAG TPA: histidine--tRNA ligase [Thermodesulfobacteriota bacterium]